MKKISEQFPRGVEIVGSAIIENDKGEILLTRSPKWSNKWVLPGGHIEPGEKIMDAIVREASEEVGLKLTPRRLVAYGELIGSKDFHRPAHFIYFDVWCTTDNSAVQLDNNELTEYRWMEPYKALTMDLAESYPETIAKFTEYKKSYEQ